VRACPTDSHAALDEGIRELKAAYSNSGIDWNISKRYLDCCRWQHQGISDKPSSASAAMDDAANGIDGDADW